MLVDSHCHFHLIEDDAFNEDISGLIENAKNNGIEKFLCVATHPNQKEVLNKLADEYPDIYISQGLHPNEKMSHELDYDGFLKLFSHDKVIAVGETGLDYFRSGPEMKKIQHTRFCTQIAIAKYLKLPLIIHSREAKEDTVRVLDDENAKEVGGVIHCFTEDWDMAKRCIDLGFMISFSGIVTFKNAKTLQEVAKKIPPEFMLIETDTPYLAPVPYRGKVNQPAYVKHVAEFIADLRGDSFEDVAKITTDNFYRIFLNARANKG